MKVLIVDDMQENLYLLETLLKGYGHEVIIAANGVEALTKLRGEGADIIIADILMPVMDGFQLCKEVRADSSFKDIYFIFLSATYTDEKDEELAMMLGADLFLRKPLEPDELVDILQRTAQAIEEGTIQAIISQDPYQMGYQGVAAIDAFINGQKIENPKVELKPVLITPENYDTPEVKALLQTPDKFEQ